MRSTGLPKKYFCLLPLALLALCNHLSAQVPPDVLWNKVSHGYFIAPVAISPVGDLAAFPGANSAVRLVRLTDGSPVRNLSTAPGLGSISFSADGTLLAATSEDRALRIWEVATGTLLRTIPQGGGNKQFTAVAFHPDGQHVAADTNRTRVSLWKVADGTAVWHSFGNSVEIQAITFSPDGSLLAVAGGYRGVDVNIRILRSSDGVLLQTLKTENSYGVQQLSFSPDGQYLLAGCNDNSFPGAVELWRVADWTRIQKLPVTAPAVAFSPNGKVIITLRHATMDFWSFPDCIPLGSLGRVGTNDYASQYSLAVSPGGNRILAANYRRIYTPNGTLTEASATAIRFPTFLRSTAKSGELTMNWFSGGSRTCQLQSRSLASDQWLNVGHPTTNTSIILPLEGSDALFRLNIKE